MKKTASSARRARSSAALAALLGGLPRGERLGVRARMPYVPPPLAVDVAVRPRADPPPVSPVPVRKVVPALPAGPRPVGDLVPVQARLREQLDRERLVPHARQRDREALVAKGKALKDEITAKETELALKESPEVVTVVNRIGRPEGAVDMAGPESSDVFVILKPPAEWKTARTREGLVTAMEDALREAQPGTLFNFTQPIEMRFNEILEGTRADIAVKVFGDDYAEIERLATEVREILEQVPGAADVEFDALGKAPMLEIKLKRDAMARYNIHAGEVNAAVATALAGTEAAWQLHGLGWPVARVAESLAARSLVGGDGWVSNRVKFIQSPSRPR